MPTELPRRAGAAPEARQTCAPQACAPKHIAFVQLITTAALALSTAVAVTAVRSALRAPT